jgi:hypothetical protein
MKEQQNGDKKFRECQREKRGSKETKAFFKS